MNIIALSRTKRKRPGETMVITQANTVSELRP